MQSLTSRMCNRKMPIVFTEARCKLLSSPTRPRGCPQHQTNAKQCCNRCRVGQMSPSYGGRSRSPAETSACKKTPIVPKEGFSHPLDFLLKCRHSSPEWRCSWWHCSTSYLSFVQNGSIRVDQLQWQQKGCNQSEFSILVNSPPIGLS